MGKQWKQWQTFFSWAPKSLQTVIAAMKLKDTPWKESYDQSRQHIKKQRHYFTNKGTSSQSYGFSNSHVWMWELDYKETWVPKNWCFWTVMLKTLESPLDCKEIQPVHPKGNQSWIFIGRTDAETPILWPPDGKNWLTGKDPDAGKDWGQKGSTDQMVGWHHRLGGHELSELREPVWTGVVCCSPWGLRVGHDWVTELNWDPHLEMSVDLKLRSCKGQKCNPLIRLQAPVISSSNLQTS